MTKLLDAYAELDRPRRVLAVTGLTIVLVGLVHALVWLVQGGPALGPVSWRKPTTFSLGIGGILLVTLWASRHIEMSRKMTWGLLGGFVVAGLIQASLVVVQMWRGTPSHFNVFTTDTNAVIAIVIAFTTVPTTVMFVILTVQAYRHGSATGSTRTLIRYGLTMISLGTVQGLTMIGHAVSTIPSRIAGSPHPPFIYGDAGILLAPHLTALHGLLFAMVLGAITQRTIADPTRRHGVILTFLGLHATLVALLGYQTYSGLAPLAVSLPTMAVVAVAVLLCIFAIPRMTPRNFAQLALPTLLVVGLGSGCAVPEPVEGIGMETIILTDPARDRSFAVDIWYPTADKDADWYRPVPMTRPVFLSRGAIPTQGKRPLVLVSHGALGFRYAQAWLAEDLVARGYVVALLDHPGSMRGNLTGEGMFTLYHRALDVSFAIDQLLASKRWSSIIDASKIGFASHSAGGHTGLLLAGAHFDPKAFRAYRDTNPPGDIYATELKQYDALEATVDASRYSESFHEPRIGAYLLMAPSPVTGFSAETLKKINTNVRIYSSKRDEINPPEAHSLFAAKHIPNATVKMNDTGHFVYVIEGSVFGKRAIPSIFDDTSDIDREAIQTALGKDAASFFGGALGGAG